MSCLRLLLAVLLVCAAPHGLTHAQAVFEVPFGSEANTIELAVVNRSATESVAGATVVLTAAPV